MTTTITASYGFTLIKTARCDYHVTDNRRDKWGGLVSANIDFSEHYGRYMGHVAGHPTEAVLMARDLHDCWLMVREKCLMVFPEAA